MASGIQIKNSTLATAAAAFVGVSALVVLFKYLKSKQFKKVAVLKKIVIFPVKSLKGVIVPKAVCTPEGPAWQLLRDRSFLIVKDNEFISQREEPTLLQVDVSFDGTYICIDAEGLPTLKVEAVDSNINDKPVVEVIVRKNTYKSVDCGDEASKWFQTFLKKDDNIRLVRIISHKDGSHRGRRGSVPMFFHDRVAVHVLSEASLESLNSKLDEDDTCTENTFRPNFLIEGCPAHAEDSWESMKVGDAVLNFYDRCPRCLMTTVKLPGIRTDKEPLETLRKYRTDRSEIGKKKYLFNPLFGARFYVSKRGEVNVGDDIYAVISNNPLL